MCSPLTRKAICCSFCPLPYFIVCMILEAIMSFMINRRRFSQTASASLAMSTLRASGLDLIHQKPRRVGLIVTGWYGKSDLFRPIQIAPVEVISLCDVDRNLLSEAAMLVSQRQKSGKTPRTYTDYRVMLKEKDLDIVLLVLVCGDLVCIICPSYVYGFSDVFSGAV
jgi:hypothetical protein